MTHNLVVIQKIFLKIIDKKKKEVFWFPQIKKTVYENICVKTINGIEKLFLKLSLPHDIRLIIGCVYIPPTTTIEMYAKHCDLLESIALQ